jgi:hypothetical protein
MQRFAPAVLAAAVAIGVLLAGANAALDWWTIYRHPVAAHEFAVPVDPGAYPQEPPTWAIVGRAIKDFTEYLGFGILWSALLLVPILLLGERILGATFRGYAVSSVVAGAASSFVLVGLQSVHHGESQAESDFATLSIVLSALVGLFASVAAAATLSANKSLERTRDR